MSGKIKLGLLAGTISGIVLGLVLKGVETVTGELVYTLLLNVDFIPVIGDKNLPELIEFGFHLIISLVIGVVFSIICSRFFPNRTKAQAVFAGVLTLPTVFLYFPLTYLATKPTPDLLNVTAISYWALGHVIYAGFLFSVYRMNEERFV